MSGTSGEHPEIGSVGEEAARLLDAVADVLGSGRSGSPSGGPSGSPSGGASRAGTEGDGGRSTTEGLSALFSDAVGALRDVSRDVDAHVATGAEECRWCPVCRAVHRVRETAPEVREHLLGAARSLLAAGSALVEQLEQGAQPDAQPDVQPDVRPGGQPGTQRPQPRPGRPSGVQRIDLDLPEEPADPSQHDPSGATCPEEDLR